MSLVALVPCRGGSKRIPGKNTKLLGGKPLVYWTLDAAFQSGIFDRVVLCPDVACTLPDLSAYYGLEAIVRPESRDDEPDIQWVRYVLSQPTLDTYDAFAILRPTSPFRTADTIRRAWALFQTVPTHALRAMEPVTQHPDKMWLLLENRTCATPVTRDDEGYARRHWRDGPLKGVPYHSSPTQTLKPYYVQNASLEIAPTVLVLNEHQIAGDFVTPFFTEGWEGFDINTLEDWDRAEAHVAAL